MSDEPQDFPGVALPFSDGQIKARIKNKLVMLAEALPFNVVDELLENRAEYTIPKGEEFYTLSITGYAWPNIVAAVGEAARGTHKKCPSDDAVMACAIRGGIAYFRQDPQLKILLDLRSQLRRAPAVSGEKARICHWIFDEFDLSLIFHGRRRTFRLPMDIGTDLADLHREAGVQTTLLASLCLCAMFEDMRPRNLVPPDDRLTMADALDTFFRRIEYKVLTGSAVMDALGLKIPGSASSSASPVTQ